jgi:hypothetical protein
MAKALSKARPPECSIHPTEKLAAALKAYKNATGVDLTSIHFNALPEVKTARRYLGFDCATKTLGHGVVDIDLDGYLQRRAALWVGLLRAKRGLLTIDEIKNIDAETKGYITLVSGAVVDLFPGRADATVHTVERVKALAKYVKTEILPTLPPPGQIDIIVEFQMGQNANTRTIAAALIALLHEYKIYLVGPSLKNKVALTEDGRYAHFAQKYKSSYSANKAHAKFNFSTLEQLFTSKLPPIKPSLRVHLADAVMQIFGHLIYGAADPEDHF